MHTYGVVTRGSRLFSGGSIRCLVLAAFAAGVFVPGELARADNRRASATITFWASCTDQGCEQASGEVKFWGNCDGTTCTVGTDNSFNNPCPPGNTVPVSLVLHNVNEGGCANSSNESPFPVDLLAGGFVLSQTQWDNLVAGNYVVDVSLGPVTAGGTAKGSGSTAKATPAISEWGLVVMVLLGIPIGAVILRRASLKPA